MTSRLILRAMRNRSRRFATSPPPAAQHRQQAIDEDGQVYNEMTARPFPPDNEPDWNRRVILVGYVGIAICGGLYLGYYKPDTTLETWALGEAEKRMRVRGVDMWWLAGENFAIKQSWRPFFG